MKVEGGRMKLIGAVKAVGFHPSSFRLHP
jgi:hypothetical protein